MDIPLQSQCSRSLLVLAVPWPQFQRERHWWHQKRCPPAGSSCRDKLKDNYFAAMSEARLVQLLCQHRTLPWVHYESSEEVRPCDVVHRILFRGDGSSNNLCIHVIRQHLEKTKHCSGRTENQTSICGIKFLVTSQNLQYCRSIAWTVTGVYEINSDEINSDEINLPPDQLSHLLLKTLFDSNWDLRYAG